MLLFTLFACMDTASQSDVDALNDLLIEQQAIMALQEQRYEALLEKTSELEARLNNLTSGVLHVLWFAYLLFASHSHTHIEPQYAVKTTAL